MNSNNRVKQTIKSDHSDHRPGGSSTNKALKPKEKRAGSKPSPKASFDLDDRILEKRKFTSSWIFMLP